MSGSAPVRTSKRLINISNRPFIVMKRRHRDIKANRLQVGIMLADRRAPPYISRQKSHKRAKEMSIREHYYACEHRARRGRHLGRVAMGLMAQHDRVRCNDIMLTPCGLSARMS